MDADEARRRLARARVARLATVRPDGRPHVVPVCFALVGDTAYSAVDQKPKRSDRLQRLANVRGGSAAALLADEWSEDWAELWWVRADGRARVVENDGGDNGEWAAAHAALRNRYPQYADHRLGAVVAVDVERWTGWP